MQDVWTKGWYEDDEVLEERKNAGTDEPDPEELERRRTEGLEETSEEELETRKTYGLDEDKDGELDKRVSSGFENSKKDDTIRSNDKAIRNMANGLRRSPFNKLSEEEIKRILKDAKELNIPEEVLEFNVGGQTGFSDSTNTIHVRGDIMPDTDSANLRDNLSPRAVLAHEYYGHYKHHPSQFPPGDWRDEFRASYRGALDAPNLSLEERRMLMLDAYDRASEAGVKVKYNVEARRLLDDKDNSNDPKGL